MSKQSVLFLGAKPIGYQCLAYLIQNQEELGIQIDGVLTNDHKNFQTSESVSQLAEKNHITVYNNLDNLPTCDYLISVQYHEILKEKHITRARKLAVNLHMAPLPEYRGCNQFSLAIIDNKKEFGTTLHQIDTRIDHGGIIAEKRFPIPADCWVHTLYDLTYEASVELFTTTMPAIFSDNYSITPQHTLEEIRGSALHFRKEIQSLKQIDLQWDADKIKRHIRATYMPGFEPPFTYIHDQKVYFTTTWNPKP